MGLNRKSRKDGQKGVRYTVFDRWNYSIMLWVAVHIERMPYIVSTWLSRRFDISRLVAHTDDPMPRRLLFRRIYRPEVLRDGTYRYARMPLTFGRRCHVMQAIQRNDTPEALHLFYRLPRLCFVLGAFGKVNRMACYMVNDLTARQRRDNRLNSPLTDIERRAGYDRLNFGLFGIIDYVATRNGITYADVEGMSDDTIYAIMKIDHDKAEVERRRIELQSKQLTLTKGR